MNKIYISSIISLGTLLLGGGVGAQEHGTVPIARSVYVDQAEPGFRALVSSDLGLHVTWDRWATSFWVCEDIIGYDVETFALAGEPTGDPRERVWLAGGPGATLDEVPVPVDGLWRSVNGGCDWAPVGGVMAGQWARRLLVHPERPSEVLVATQHFEKPNGVAISEDAGATWRWTGLEGVEQRLNGLVRAPSDPSRLYASAPHGLWRSEDGGATWTMFGAGLAPEESDVIEVQAVHPSDPDVVYLFVSTSAGRALYVGRDGGEAVELIHQAPTRDEAAMAAVPDGAGGVTLVMGSRLGYTWSLRAGAEAWEEVEGFVPIECLVPDPDVAGALLVCSNIWAQFIPPLIALGRTADALESIEPIFTYGDTTDYLRCAETSQINTICIPLDSPNPGSDAGIGGEEVGVGGEDAGADAADAGGSAGGMGGGDDGCGCGVAPGVTTRHIGGALSVLLLSLAMWRRRA